MKPSHPYEDKLTPRRSMENPLRFLPIPVIAAACGWTLVLSSEHGAKWFVMFFLATIAFFIFLLFKNPYVFGSWLLASCAPVVFQYKLLSHGEDRGRVFDHFGGAINEPVLSLVDFPIVLLAVCWLADLAIHRKQPLPKWTKFDSLLVIFLVMSCASLYNSTEHALFTFEMLRYIKYLVLYWSLRTFLQKDNPWCLGGIFVVSILVLPEQALVSILQYFYFFVLPIPVGGVQMASFELVNGELIQRVTGFVGHSNTFAHYLLVPLTFCLAFFFVRASVLWKALVVPFFMCGLVCLVLTFSRSGWLTVCVCGVIVGCAALFTGRFKMTYIAMMLAAGFIVIGWVFVADVWEPIMVRVFEDSGNAYDSRWDLACLSARVIGDYPVIGIGLNSFEEHMPHYDINGIQNIIDRPVHNVFLLIAAETGVGTACVFLALGITLLVYSYRILKGPSEREFFVGTVGFTVFFALGFTNMLDLSLRHEALMGMITIMAAVVVAEYARVVKLRAPALASQPSRIQALAARTFPLSGPRPAGASAFSAHMPANDEVTPGGACSAT